MILELEKIINQYSKESLQSVNHEYLSKYHWRDYGNYLCYRPANSILATQIVYRSGKIPLVHGINDFIHRIQSNKTVGQLSKNY